MSENFDNYTLFRGQGHWNDRTEEAYQLLIITDDEVTVQTLIKHLKDTFSQDSIVEIRYPAADVIFHES